ncbi:MAG: type I methionyl aminopeptidase [Candidatus Omnitrophica bacterium]|nr:type I methionyl aminopeptidase [Candidatus Omnitrophota bacterium]
MISIKSQAELGLMAQAGRIVSLIIEELASKAKPGISTYELDKKADILLQQSSAKSAFKGYNGFPGNICTSLNNELIHGIPSKKRILKEADILSLDVGVNFKGYYADAAVTLPVGNINIDAIRLIAAARKALYSGIDKARSKGRLSDISCAVQRYVEESGYSVVRDFVGHGIGSRIHEDPEIPNYGLPGHGPALKPNMVLAIEPMINAGGHKVKVLADGWTVVTCDGKLSAHFEHTVCVTEGEPLILTASKLI